MGACPEAPAGWLNMHVCRCYPPHEPGAFEHHADTRHTDSPSFGCKFRQLRAGGATTGVGSLWRTSPGELLAVAVDLGEVLACLVGVTGAQTFVVLNLQYQIRNGGLNHNRLSAARQDERSLHTSLTLTPQSCCLTRGSTSMAVHLPSLSTMRLFPGLVLRHGVKHLRLVALARLRPVAAQVNGAKMATVRPGCLDGSATGCRSSADFF